MFDGTWFHFIETVYGAWLYGDERGFRTRHHREHVEGDYNAPPPIDQYAEVRQRSVERLKQSTVIVPSTLRPIVGGAVRDRLVDQSVFVLCLSMSGQHSHCLAKVPDGLEPRIVMGRAKKHSAFEAKEAGFEGKLWGKRGKELRIRNRAHQLSAYRYILRHEEEGAWIWLNPMVKSKGGSKE